MVYKNYYAAQNRKYLDKYERWKKQASLLGLSQEAKKRLAWFIYFETRGDCNASKTSRYFGIGRSTFYKWLNRFDEQNLKSLEEESRIPKHCRKRQYSKVKDERIIKLRKQYPYFGKQKLVQIYKNIYAENVTNWYVQRVIEEYQLYFRKKKKQYTKQKSKQIQKKKKITELLSHKKPPKEGFFIHLDTIVFYKDGTKRYLITSIEESTKFAFARMYTSIKSSSAADFLHRMAYIMKNHKTKISTVHTDNGTEFHKNFILATKKLKLDHYWSRPHTPKDNASNERFNRTIRETFVNWGNYNSNPDIFNKNLTEWLIEYNAIRPHESLGMKTPLQALEQTVGLSTMWSSCTSA